MLQTSFLTIAIEFENMLISWQTFALLACEWNAPLVGFHFIIEKLKFFEWYVYITVLVSLEIKIAQALMNKVNVKRHPKLLTKSSEIFY